ncbi:MAG: DUF3370 domain-containing protein [Elainellaceae cyanobacterium]
MLTFLSILSFAQVALPVNPPLAPPPASTIRREIVEPQEVRPLPGNLDTTPVFNSNSPELIQQEGILLSTFPPDGMAVSSAHLNYAFDGRFDVFAHHIAKGLSPDDVRTLYIGVVVYNPNDRPVTVDVLQGVSYLSQEAPFRNLPAYVANPLGTVFSGPGSRTMADILRGDRQSHWPTLLEIPPKHAQILMNVPIPLRQLSVPTNGSLPPGRVILPPPISSSASTNNIRNRNSQAASQQSPSEDRLLPDNRPIPINGRTSLMRLWSSGPVHVASLAMYAPSTPDGNERVPTLYEWLQLLTRGGLAGPRDRPPTSPDTRYVFRFFYGRVAGVAQGSRWEAELTDPSGGDRLTIPSSGESISYVLSTVDRNTFGTEQIQSAPMLVRYPDTAYRAHGNYGIEYDLTLPLKNSTDTTQTVALLIQTPLQNEELDDALKFIRPPDEQVFFRGTVRIRYIDDWRTPQIRYFHLVQRRGQQGQPLIRLRMRPREQREVRVQFLYPPDSTPPQVLTIENLDG